MPEDAPTPFPTAVLFGGTGFIGSHFASYLLEHRLADRVVLVDIRPPTSELDRRMSFVEADVRRELPVSITAQPPSLIANLAAVHREPGHEAREYFETNVLGAENVCQYAAAIACDTMIFTSSISVYGPTEHEKDETSLPVPTTPYGGSKLVAERVHASWQQAAPDRRRLLTVRPGVVFGPGEGGNVTRLVRAVSGGYFVFCGNHHVRKAGGYVKELCHAIAWGLGALDTPEQSNLLFNFTFDPTPRLDEFVAAVADVAQVRRPVLSVPYPSILAASYFAHAASRLLGIQQPLHPLRARKLVLSNHISSRVLRERGYVRAYSLASALRDWKNSLPADWPVKRRR